VTLLPYDIMVKSK